MSLARVLETFILQIYNCQERITLSTNLQLKSYRPSLRDTGRQIKKPSYWFE